MERIQRDGRRQGNSFLFPLPLIIFALLFLSACNLQTQESKKESTTAKTATVSGPPKVTQIDEAGLKDLLKPNGKPLLINFWATWCGPCREEFPDLVKIGTDHKDKIDLITVTLDDVSEINGDVPKFLAEMRSDAPAYLLKAQDESAAIALVSPDWKGALPFTILVSAQGETIYSKQGKFEKDALVSEIESLAK